MIERVDGLCQQVLYDTPSINGVNGSGYGTVISGTAGRKKQKETRIDG